MHGLGQGDFEASNHALRQICGAYRINCDRWWEFRGSIRTFRVGSLDVADVSVSPCAVVRDRRDAHYLGDQLFLVFQAQGTARMRQRGSEITLSPGDATLIDSRFPSVFETSQGFRQYSFHLPRELVLERLGSRPIPVARMIRGAQGAGRVLSDLLTSFARNALVLQNVDLLCVTLPLLSAALGLEEPAQAAPALRHRSVDAREVAHYIDAHTEWTDLTPQTIAAHFNLSVRQLYRVIAATGFTPASLIWRRRLEQAHSLLSRCDARVPIIEIALSCGFKDGAHFSRAYRKLYGHSPKTARSGAASAGPSATPPA